MTTPDERMRAVMQTRDFLQELAWPSAEAHIPEHLRREAQRLLRHYPSGSNMSLVHDVLPGWFGAVPPRQGTGRRASQPHERAEDREVWRVGIVQTVDLTNGRCTLLDGLTESLHRFVAKTDAERAALANISKGNYVDYRVGRRGRVMSVSKAYSEGTAVGSELPDGAAGS